MEKYSQALDKFVVELTSLIIKFKYVVAIAMIAIAMAIATGGKLLSFTPDYRVFFSGENPELNAFLDFQDTYVKNDNFYFVLKPKDGNVFSKETLTAVQELTKNAWTIPFANRVDSIVNFQNSYADGNDLVVEDLVYDASSLSDTEIQEKSKVAFNEPLLRDLLVTKDGSVTAVNVILQLPGETVYEVPTAAAKAREFKADIEARYPNIDVTLTGWGMLNNAFGESGYMDSIKLVPVMYGVLVIAGLLVLRSLVGTFTTLVVAFLSMGVGMGVGGYSGIQLTPVSNSAPIVIITLAIADSIHIFLTFKKLVKSGMMKLEALTESMRVNFVPVTITSLTTVIGFLSLNFSDSPPFWHLGNMSAVGIAAAWLLSVTLLPALIAILPFRAKASAGEQLSDRAGAALGKFLIGNAKTILLVGVLSSLGLVAAIPSLEFNDQWSDYFDESIEFRRDTDEATKYFGLYPIEYSVPAPGSQGVSDPQYLAKLQEFTEFLRKQEHVVHVYSITDILKRLNRNMHADDSSYYKLPENRESAAEYLLVYELSLPYGLDLNDRINIDKSASRVTVMLGKTTTTETKQFLDSTNIWIQKNLPSYMQVTSPTSPHVMFTYITDRNVSAMISGTVVAISVIALILAFSLRSIPLGLLSLIPNGLPIVTAFGAWSLLVGSVGFSVAAVAAISLGIVVDDTVHILSKYNLARKEKGYSSEDAVIYAYKTVGSAVVSNTIILICGFVVMASSTFKINGDLGLLTAITIFLALLFDLFLLPALLLVFDRKPSFEIPGEMLGMDNLKTLSTTGKTLAIVVGFSMLVLEPGNVKAAEVDPMQKGFEISALSDRSDRGFSSSDVHVSMILRNASGMESVRDLEVKTLEMPDEEVGDKSIVIFEQPADISGTALLSHAKILDADDQWLLLNSTKRVKRISSRNKSGPFVGSEFAFEDFTSLELNKYTHEWVNQEEYAGMKCDVVKRVPRYEYSGYSYMLAWIDQDVYQVRKIEYFDRKGDLLKTLVLEDYKLYGDYWRAQTLKMKNHQTRKSTDLVYGPYQFNVGLEDRDFVKERLKRIR